MAAMAIDAITATAIAPPAVLSSSASAASGSGDGVGALGDELAEAETVGDADGLADTLDEAVGLAETEAVAEAVGVGLGRSETMRAASWDSTDTKLEVNRPSLSLVPDTVRPLNDRLSSSMESAVHSPSSSS